MGQHIGIHGFYGMQNLGDEALLHVFLQEVRKALPDYAPVVYSMRPDRIRRDYGVSSVWTHPGRKRWILQQWSLWRNRLFILGGGGILHDYGPDSSGIRTWLSLLSRSLQLGRKTALFFIGVDTIRHEESRQLIADTIPQVDFISVRDQRSAEFLRDIGVTQPIHQAIDPAILLVQPRQRRRCGGTPLRVAVCLRHWFKSSMETEDKVLFPIILDELGASLNRLIEHYNAEIVFYPMRDIHYDDDCIINREVCDRLERPDCARCIDTPPSIPDFIDALDEVDLMIGMRLHALILASAKGIPVIALEYMPKVSEYMQSIGQGAYILPMDSSIGERLNNNIDSILEDYNTVSCGLVDSLSKKQVSVRRVLDQMFSLIT
jgi:polysaccharide pyruvyl transferase CsaB